ncbi:MAG: hypothetical protein ABI618_02915 [Nitrospirota bacterium]
MKRFFGNHSKGDAWFEGANDPSERVSHNYWETTCRGIKRGKLLDPVLRRDISPGRGGRGAYAQINLLGISKEMPVLRNGNMTAATDHRLSDMGWAGSRRCP